MRERRLRLALPGLVLSLLAACASTPSRTPPRAVGAWDARVAALQAWPAWQLDGRAAVAVGTQGWQASLDWKEQGADAEVHLAGPLGIGAMVLRRTADGISVNGAAPGADVEAQLEARLGFELPLDHLRFWLLGVPDPALPFEVSRNDQDRAAHLSQDGWTLDYDKYLPVSGDLLPGHLVLTRDTIRVRIVIDRWAAGS